MSCGIFQVDMFMKSAKLTKIEIKLEFNVNNIYKNIQKYKQKRTKIPKQSHAHIKKTLIHINIM